MEHKIYKMHLGSKELSIEVGKYAELAHGACTVRCGDTVVLVTAAMSSSPRPGIDFFPLSVDFRERLYSVGRIPGGYIRREGRPSDRATLLSRLIDRPLRPLFPKGFRNDVQIIAMPMAIEVDYLPGILAMIGSSTALSMSKIPFAGPTGSISVAMVDGQLIAYPNKEEREKSVLDLVVAGTKDAVMMVEAAANELGEDDMLKAIMFAHDVIKDIVALQEEIAADANVDKVEYDVQLPSDDAVEAVKEYAFDKLTEIVKSIDKDERAKNTNALKADIVENLSEKFPDMADEIDDIMYSLNKIAIRRRILDDGIRPDGRAMTEVRQLTSEVGLLPLTHGTGHFKRGQTQVLTVCTLGPMADKQLLDDIWDEESKRFMHHYNFPPYSVGETRPVRGPGRREIGHGALAERSLIPVLPSIEEFPYTIRLVSEVLSSNGSTSQASVCGSTLALMDAGVPIKAAVAGVAMGLIKDDISDKVAVLTDIQGLEDFLGDMDFKVAGTSRGITAIQMDIKIKGIGRDILEKALAQAKDGRMHIMRNMLDTISAPRAELSANAPKIISLNIHPDKIREVIGPGGKMINHIIAETDAKIDIDDTGKVYIYAINQANGDKALKMVEDIVREIEVGEEYEGTVKRIMDFGAFVEILPGKEGLVHISKLAFERVAKVEDVLNIGDKVMVKVMEIDSQKRINLSRRALLEQPEGWVEPVRQSRPPRRDNNRGGNRPQRRYDSKRD